MAGNRSSDDPRSVAERVFAIADAFGGPGSDDLTLGEIARRSGLPLSTTHRLVTEWVEWGGIVRTDEGRYRVGMRLWKLGMRAPTARRLRTVARPYLEDLYELTRENVHLAVRDGLGALYLERFSGRGAVPVISEVGSRLPLHATGVGLVLLAFAPADVFEQVVQARPRRYLQNTMTTDPELRPRLADIRARDLVVSVNEMTEDSFSAAAPIRDHTGEVVAAVSIVAHADRSADPQFPLAVSVAARGISRALGWRA
ncbi:IclR family transcriptional regulator [Lacisediminihabitans profunda]|uniref:IclR family transcriptional regulator n=1 Tax=Lacisediminihabitans profunda TaxID=2594790 RepID=A0A5C8UM29_9MICO|nr:IclR family transcriptional regulator [Lacisediminihabitans profunda]TXN28340.1 IclR family transcriptional regulator [Lacisediminihabitans profunda]